MYLKFLRIDASGFQSLERAKVDLCNRGVVLVRGENQWEENSKSNGSGKSSIFEAILWALYGKTSSGISNAENRYLGGRCRVKLEFLLDDIHYVVKREVSNGKSSVVLLKDGEDVSGRNKTDTDKMILDQLLGFGPDIFCSTIFLAQGFGSRLSALTPSGRKERLETITQTSKRLDLFKTRLTSKKQVVSKNLSQKNAAVSNLEGQQYAINQEVLNLTSELTKIKNVSTLGEDEKRALQNEIDGLEKSLAELEVVDTEVNENLSTASSKLSDLKSLKQNLDYENSEVSHKISAVDVNKCPTCGSGLSEEQVNQLRGEYKSKIAILENKLSIVKSKISNVNKSVDSLREKKSLLKRKRDAITAEIYHVHTTLSKSEVDSALVSTKEDTINRNKAKYKELSLELKNLLKERDKVSEELGVVEDILSLTVRHFRSYLLKTTVDYMNVKLSEYSSLLFSHDVDEIRIQSDSSKVDIYLGEALYGTLSGGEKRKVDLALTLALRDLSINLAGCSSNLLILDEVFDNLDDKSISVVSNMFTTVSSEIDSMFVISHKPAVEIPYDSQIMVIKDSSRVSRVSEV